MAEKTALVLVDVYNDFLHPSGKGTPALVASLENSKTIEHIQQALKNARSAQIPVYYSLHQQYHNGKYTGFEHWNAMLRSVESSHSFEEGSWGAKIFKGLEPDVKNGDVVISKHWNQRSTCPSQ
jgi:nicotinamidase-related amidase